jgi:hypothetical protein
MVNAVYTVPAHVDTYVLCAARGYVQSDRVIARGVLRWLG